MYCKINQETGDKIGSNLLTDVIKSFLCPTKTKNNLGPPNQNSGFMGQN